MELAVTSPLTMGSVERAHGALNAAWDAITPGQLRVDLARGYVAEAWDELAAGSGHDGPEDALVAARLMLPRVARAAHLLDELGVAPTAVEVQAVLDQLGIAMDHAEEALGAVGWE